MKSKTAVWLCLLAGLLWVILSLRDIFAPGFFSMSPRVVGKLDITMELATAAAFLIVAATLEQSRRQGRSMKK